MGLRFSYPMSAELNEALERHTLRQGREPEDPLFPAPNDPSQPIRHDVLDVVNLEPD